MSKCFSTCVSHHYLGYIKNICCAYETQTGLGGLHVCMFVTNSAVHKLFRHCSSKGSLPKQWQDLGGQAGLACGGDGHKPKQLSQFSLYAWLGTVMMKFHKLCGLGRGRLVSPSNCRSEFKEEHQEVLEKGLLRPLRPHPLRASQHPSPVWEITSIPMPRVSFYFVSSAEDPASKSGDLLRCSDFSEPLLVPLSFLSLVSIYFAIQS